MHNYYTKFLLRSALLQSSVLSLFHREIGESYEIVIPTMGFLALLLIYFVALLIIQIGLT